MSGFHNFDRLPVIQVSSHERDCYCGWQGVVGELNRHVPNDQPLTMAIECYPGVYLDALAATLRAVFLDANVLCVNESYQDSDVVRARVQPILSSDPVFGRMQLLDIGTYFNQSLVRQLKAVIASKKGLTILIGTGTDQVAPSPDLLLHASVTRWELQQRQRAHRIGNLGLANLDDSPSLLYKGAFFLEWRTADDIRHKLFRNVDYFLDLDDQEVPCMVDGDVLRGAIATAVTRPFRVTPFFDPGPWGGRRMKETFDLPPEAPNYAWCFDCVPEENSVTFGFGARRFQLPAIVLVHEEPKALLGSVVTQRFGAEFPIRFDLLDTVGGGNLSLQVHPLTSYIRKHFGMNYTQDESYYILDCEEGSELYLGFREGIDREEMIRDLQVAQAAEVAFPADRYVNTWSTRKHDHFSIPAGTIHCSGSGNLVLEISATPYLFTFKLWDWERVGLDGKPRHIHLEHGLANLQWDRDTGWVKRELLDQVESVSSGRGWREERTGLHCSEFIETRRTWFTEAVPLDTAGNVNVLNLVEGNAAIVESPSGAFPPFEIHYAETFIVPASVGPYLIRPLEKVDMPLGIIRAFVRPGG